MMCRFGAGRFHPSAAAQRRAQETQHFGTLPSRSEMMTHPAGVLGYGTGLPSGGSDTPKGWARVFSVGILGSILRERGAYGAFCQGAHLDENFKSLNRRKFVR